MTRPILPPYAEADFPEYAEKPEGASVVEVRDEPGFSVDFRPGIVYATRAGRPLNLTLLIPRDGRAAHPLIVYVQGSAWFQQNIYEHLAETMMAAQAGFCVALVTYRPSTEAPFPAQTEDCKTAIRFLRAHAAQFQIDGERVGLWGDSSGGHTVLMAGFTQDDVLNAPDDPPESARVQCIVDWYGPTVVSQMAYEPSGGEHESADCPEGWLIGHKRVSEHPELAEATVPMKYLRDGVETPPVLILHGTRDRIVNFAQSVHLYEALRGQGRPVEFIQLKGADHGWRGFQNPRVVGMVIEFLKKHLG